MPELPEVETIRVQLERHILHKRIKSVTTWLPKMWRNVPPTVGEQLLIGNQFTKIDRRGKYLLFHLQDGWILIVHLKMTGRLVYSQSSLEVGRHDRLGLTFEDGSSLHYGDMRTFGGFYFYESIDKIDIKGLCTMGVEPLSDEFTVEKMYELTRKSRMPLKSFLLDQRFVAGLGNIYVDEANFEARLHPLRKANSLTKREAKRLHTAIQKVLTMSIQHGGTTFRNYLDSEGGRGENKKNLQVYGRAGDVCLVCGHPLEKIVLGGRSTVYCPKCQK